MNVTVRRATVDDAALVASLNADVQAIHAAALPRRFKPPGSEDFSAEASALLAGPDNLVFVAEVAGVPAGYAYAEVMRRPQTSLVYAQQTVYIHHISVRADHRRRGVGSALLEAVRTAGQELGITLLGLDVWMFNDSARAFFRRQGFAPYVERLWNHDGAANN